MENLVDNKFKERFPCKIVFAYKGQILSEWAEELNELVRRHPEQLYTLPDYIIVNKQGMIQKKIEGEGVLTTGETIRTHFLCSIFNEDKKYCVPFLHLFHELYGNALNQYYIFPSYEKYFNKDM